jgi:hypothetical protein
MAGASLGAFTFTFLLAGLLTLVVGVGLVFSYRRAVRRYMRRRLGPVTSPRRSIEEILALASGSDPSRVRISLVPATDRTTPRAETNEFRTARFAYLSASAVYVAAGLWHAGIITVLFFSFAGIEFLPFRTLLSFWAYAWPVLLTLILLWAPDRWRQSLAVLAYFAVLAVICLWAGAFTVASPLVIGGGLIPTFTVSAYLQPLALWAVNASSSVYLLVFLNRRIRNVGPLILLFMAISLIGANFAFFAMETRLGMQWAVALSLVLERTTGNGAILTLYGLQLLGALLFAIPAWFIVRSMVRRYTLKRTSDQSLLLDSVWLFMTLFDCIDLSLDRSFIGWSGLAAFGAYKLVLALGLKPLERTAARRHNVQLLLLRVFGRRRHSERLFSLLSARWRYAGNIQLIAGSDLATTTLEPHQFLDFLSGRLRQNFIYDATDLERRLSTIDLRPDPDGRFRVNALFCSADAWRSAVTGLIDRTDVVLMDLRGFSATNAGCIFELQVLIDRIPLSRVVLLVDNTTEQPLLEKILVSLSTSMDPNSPNATDLPAEIRLLKLDGSTGGGVQKFVRLCEDIMTKRPREVA